MVWPVAEEVSDVVVEFGDDELNGSVEVRVCGDELGGVACCGAGGAVVPGDPEPLVVPAHDRDASFCRELKIESEAVSVMVNSAGWREVWVAVAELRAEISEGANVLRCGLFDHDAPSRHAVRVSRRLSRSAEDTVSSYLLRTATNRSA